VERSRVFAQCYPFTILYIAILMTIGFLLDHVF
jgi:hypothetical protein